MIPKRDRVYWFFQVPELSGIIRITLRGFNLDVINDLAKKTAEFQPEERFVSLLFDDMKIEDD